MQNLTEDVISLLLHDLLQDKFFMELREHPKAKMTFRQWLVERYGQEVAEKMV